MTHSAPFRPLATTFILLISGLSLAARAPNILLILADDLGYGDVQVLNPDSGIPTPNLNRLAEEGVTFTDAHTGSAVCTPTRYGLLTGRYCWRSRLKSGVLFPPRDAPLIEDDRPTLASILKARGYRTACIGKWHLGIAWAKGEDGKVDFNKAFTNGPTDKGFDEYFGVAASLDMVPYGFLRNHQVEAPLTEIQPAQGFPRYVRRGPKDPNFDPADCLDRLAQEASTFIQKCVSQQEQSPKDASPFFLYLPLTGPHKPVWPHKRFVGTTKLGPYGDFVHQVDATVGLVLKALADSGAADNTLVIFTSDNGSFMYRRDAEEKHHLADPTNQGFRPEDHRANGPWRGTKADIWEAGHRVPFIVRWPQHATPGTRRATTICLTDVFATLTDITKAKTPAGAAEDSFSFLPDLVGGERPIPRPPVIHHSASGHYAIRQGPHKLVLSTGSGGREAPKGKAFEKPYALFNLTADPGETNNIIRDQPEIATSLEASFETIAHGDQRRPKK